MKNPLYSQHLDDCVQYAAMEYFRIKKKYPEKNIRIDFLVYRFLVSMGLSEKYSSNTRKVWGKISSTDAPMGDSENSEFLFYEKAEEEYHNKQIQETSKEDQLNNFIYDVATMFNIKEETELWATNHYRHKALNKIIN